MELRSAPTLRVRRPIDVSGRTATLGLGANHHRSDLHQMGGGRSRCTQGAQGAPELPPWIGSMAHSCGSVPILVTAVAIVSARAAGNATSFISSTTILPTIGLQIITGAAGEE